MTDQKTKVLLSVLAPFVLVSQYTEKSLEGALQLNMVLKRYGLTLVTAESLTAGMIAKTLIDVSSFGGNLYGGFVVYDSSAKRQWLNVTTPSVYSQETAKQMAQGALRNSRALVALAVTGNSQPYPNHGEALGVVDAGLAIRTKTGMKTETKRISLCVTHPELGILCGKWKAESMSASADLRSVPSEWAGKLPEDFSYFASPIHKPEGKVPHVATIQTTSSLSETPAPGHRCRCH